MRNSQEFSVAVHALLMLQSFSDLKITSEAIARSSGRNPTNVRKVFTKLRKGGLIVTRSGRGRTILARPAEQITLWDIYAAVEGKASDKMFPLHRNTDDSCKVGSHIAELMEPHYAAVLDGMKKEMSAVTLAALGRELEALAEKSP